MNLIKLREELIKEGFKPSYELTDKNNLEAKHVKIIGITGSTGKSTTACIINNYLKECGFKTVMYSTIMVDSKNSIFNNSFREEAIKSRQDILNVVEEAIICEADYIILEVNETKIKENIFKGIEFDIKLLTNINPRHNLDLFSEEEYISLKLLFMSDKDSIKIIGYNGYDAALLRQFLNQINSNLVTTAYVKDLKGIYDNSFCMLTLLNSTLNGLYLNFIIENKTYSVITKLLFSYNAYNIINSVAVLQKLNIFDIDIFQKAMKSFEIDGRNKLISDNKRLFIVSPTISEVLEELSQFKEKQYINDIILVTGFNGYGYYKWDEKYNSKEYKEKIQNSLIETAKLINEYADIAIFTNQNEASLNAKEAFNQLNIYMTGLKQCLYVDNRYNAIHRAIELEKPKDIVLVSGLGNQNTMCISKDEMILFDDTKSIYKILEESK